MSRVYDIPPFSYIFTYCPSFSPHNRGSLCSLELVGNLTKSVVVWVCILKLCMNLPWSVWLSWLERHPCTKELQARSLVRAHAQVAGLVWARVVYGRQLINVSFSHRCVSLPSLPHSSLSKKQWKKPHKTLCKFISYSNTRLLRSVSAIICWSSSLFLNIAWCSKVCNYHISLIPQYRHPDSLTSLCVAPYGPGQISELWVPNLIRHWQVTVHDGCSSLHSLPQCRWLPVTQHPH